MESGVAVGPGCPSPLWGAKMLPHRTSVWRVPRSRLDDGLAAVQTPEHLFHLMLKGGQPPLGGFELSGEFPDLGILLRGELENQRIILRDDEVLRICNGVRARFMKNDMHRS